MPSFYLGVLGQTARSVTSLPDDLDQHPLRAVAVELAVENLLPRPEVEFPLRDGDHNFPAHDLPLQVGVGVVLAGAVVVVVVRVGLNGANRSSHTPKSWCRPASSSLMNTLEVM